MFRLIIMVLFFISSFLITMTAELVPFNNRTATEIMNRLPVILVPANYVFIIWIITFLFLGFWIYGFYRQKVQQSQKTLSFQSVLFCASLILNSLFILLWHYEYFFAAVAITVVLLVMISILYFTYPKTENQFYGRLPISLYLGWIVFSFMFLSNYTLTLIAWSGWGISQTLWAVIFLTIVTAIGLHLLYHHNDFAFNLVIIWGFIGIAVKNGFDSLFVSTACLFLSAVIIACFFIFNQKRSTI